MSCVWNALGHVDVLLEVRRRPADRRSADGPARRRSAARATSPWRCAASSTGHQMRWPYGANERTGSSTWTKPGCSAARSISSTASAGWRAGDDDRAAQPRLALQPLLDQPAVGRGGQRGGGVGVLDGLGAVLADEDRGLDVPRVERERAHAVDAAGRRRPRPRGRAAGWSPRPAGTRCRSARGTASSCATSRQCGSSHGKSCSIDVDRRRGRRSRSTAAPLGSAARGDGVGRRRGHARGRPRACAVRAP